MSDNKNIESCILPIAIVALYNASHTLPNQPNGTWDFKTKLKVTIMGFYANIFTV